MKTQRLKKSIAGKCHPLRILSIYCGLFSLSMVAGCGSQSHTVPLGFNGMQINQCPAGYVPQCEVWGGNKFKKRYGPCRCSREK
jgi:hypothetical protein